MATSLTMPRLGESVTEGTVTRWLKSEGDRVEADEPLLEVSTDKVDSEIPSPAAGTILAIKVQEDQTVEIGVELAVIGEGADGAGGSPAPASEPQPGGAADPDAPAVPAAVPPVRYSSAPSSAGGQDRPDGTYLTPLVRRVAGAHGIDLRTVRGTGAGGRIRKSDVLAVLDRGATAPPVSAPAAPSVPTPAASAPSTPAPAASAPPAPAAAATPARAPRGRVEPMSWMRQVIAARMVESLQTSAQLTTVVEVDVTRVARLRDRAKAAFEAREGVALSFLPFFAVAAVEALKGHPVVNASIDTAAKTITYHDAVHLGIAVDSDRGLLVPVIHDADDLNLRGIARKIADLAERSRDNRITPDELGGGTFTVTNTGSRGALLDTPIINQPQVAILGTGAVVKRPTVVTDPDLGETIAVRSMVYLALSYDHRIVDGADAARFLTTMKQRLEGGVFERAFALLQD